LKDHEEDGHEDTKTRRTHEEDIKGFLTRILLRVLRGFVAKMSRGAITPLKAIGSIRLEE